MKRGRSGSSSRGRRSSSRGSRSPSPRRSPSVASQVSDTVERIRLTDADAAFILGKGGKTKEKIARVSGATVELPPRSLTLEITGTAEQRRKAKKYVECVMAQRIGDVIVDDDDPHFPSDCTIVEVPLECVGFVTGTNGNFLRQVEAEFGTIMFFVLLKSDGGRRQRGMEKLAIFGEKRGRRGSQLKVWAAIEGKLEGYLTKNMREHVSDSEDFGTDVRKLRMEEMSWALGRKGATRKKLARASGCIVEYVGNFVHMSGTKAERRRAGEYLSCVMDQLKGPVTMPIEGRDDVTVMHIPQDCVGYVTGLKRATLTSIEDMSGAFMLFMDRKEDSRRQDYVKLGIFGVRRNRRAAELKVMSAVEGKSPGFYTKGVKEGLESSEWGTDIFRFRGEEFSYALGKDGSTRKKLARASGCIIEYLGDFAFMAGTLAERRRAMKYLKWLLRQRAGPIRVGDLDLGRDDDDVKLMDIPAHFVSHFMGAKGSALRTVEDDTNTFLFFAKEKDGTDVLVICGADKSDRRHAEFALHDAVNDLENGLRSRDDWDRPRRDDSPPPSKYARDDRYDWSRDRSYDRGYARRSRSRSYDGGRGRSSPLRIRYDSRDRYDDRRRDDSRDRRYDSPGRGGSRDRYPRNSRERSPRDRWQGSQDRRESRDSRDRGRPGSRDRGRPDSRDRRNSRERHDRGNSRGQYRSRERYR